MSVINAIFTSVWDGGITLSSSCRVNTKTRRITKIAPVDAEGLEVLEREYISIGEQNFPAFNIIDNPNMSEDTESFWYK